MQLLSLLSNEIFLDLQQTLNISYIKHILVFKDEFSFSTSLVCFAIVSFLYVNAHNLFYTFIETH